VERGDSNKVIAQALGISISAVSTYLQRGRKKRRRSTPALDCPSRDSVAPPVLAPLVLVPQITASGLLTVAERSVLDLALGGLSNKDIARERCSSPRTVANQLAVVYRKLSVGSRRQLRSKFGW